uniref:Lysophosphatidylserine lipase ABHD12 n=1 Tax=Poecilia formosa TaxID=48698 RepID=A0A096LQ47_POEFO
DVGCSLLRLGLLGKIKRMMMVLLFVYVSIPFIIKLFPSIQAKLVFLNFVRVPYFIDLKRPLDQGLNHTHNLYLEPEAGLKIGVWHTVPAQMWRDAQDKDGNWYRSTFSSAHPVILYLHGNAGTRGGDHRVQLYKVLSSLGYHVVTFDYRGQRGDSDGSPSERGMTSDALFIYDWLRQRMEKTLPLYIWGHSLGTGYSLLSTVLVLQLIDTLTPDSGVKLSRTTQNLCSSLKSHCILLDQSEHVGGSGEFFLSLSPTAVLAGSDLNCALMHSGKTRLQIFQQNYKQEQRGAKLYSLASRSSSLSGHKVQFVAFPAALAFRHKFIYRSLELPNILSDFLGAAHPAV